ncbi:NUDIX hydrolase [Gordonia neofelifaecis]|uniref:NUDIX hydrolase n=1 Tax=Gordonia neofelifaecis NRRL B-59395 TaxID=644548 RepID=F1YL78_9ACTN|nr:NUDIX hydrolase [Gordonia neofelifaecis]EGD54538.1 NUDIX hydrolase [Gordonia neofelifaecis NRRL B-59395]
MSADPSLQRPDVEPDGPAADAATGRNGSPAKGGGQQPASGQSARARHNRRGRRRRGRRSGRGGGQQPADSKADEATSANGQSKPPPKNGSGQPKSPSGKGGGTKNPGSPSATDRRTKPSDLASRARRSNPNSPASMPRTKRRAGRKPEAENGPRLHTVRETSAGGLVLSDIDAPFGELSAALIGRIDRRGRMMWSLPKGHIETGETAEQTAMREVAEETGIEGTIVAPLGKIDYWFVSEGRRIHKTVHHYLLRFTGGELSDADYEVSAVAWVPLTELPRRLTYSDERRLARMAESVIADLQSDPHRLAQSEASCLRTEPNDYEKAAAARNQRRNEPPPAPKPRRRRRRPRRTASGES